MRIAIVGGGVASHNAVKGLALTPKSICQRFGHVRLLLQSVRNPNHASRGYALHRPDRLLTVLGGKWTTAPALASHIEHALS